MKMPMITVIVPVYNIEKYISACIESILKQTYKDMQIILVDDGSTDQSGVLCDHFATLDQRIEVIHQSNKGLVSARKEGLKKAIGKYIGFVDGDDTILPNMYQKLVDEIMQSNADFVHTGYLVNTTQKKSSFDNKIIDLSTTRKEYLKTILSEEGITPSIWSKLFKADLIKKCYYQISDECLLGEDLLNLCLCILESNKLALVNDAYYCYRIRDGSLSNKRNIYDLVNVFELYKNLCNIFSSYKCYEYMEDSLKEFLWENLLFYMAKIKENNFQIAKYYFDDFNKLYKKKIVIYGAGRVGRDYYAQISRYSDCEIVAWVDIHSEKYHYSHINVYNLDILDFINFDILIIAVWDEFSANEISNNLLKTGIDKVKLYWTKPKKYCLHNSY